MSILDRAIVKAFQRRRIAEAVAKTVPGGRCAVEPLPATTGPAATDRETTPFDSNDRLSPVSTKSSQPEVSEGVPEDATPADNGEVRFTATTPAVQPSIEHTITPLLILEATQTVSTFQDAVAVLPPPLPTERELEPPMVQVQTASDSTGRAIYTASYSRTSESAHADTTAVNGRNPTVGYTATELNPIETQTTPATIQRPIAHQWQWPEICEQLDQFTGEGFRQLAKHLQFAAEQGHKTLAFVSSTPGAGRTSVLLTLTRILALEGRTEALLVDADRRHPQLASLIEDTPTVGLRDVLHGQLRMEQAVIPMNPGRVAVLPLNEKIADAEWQQLVAPMRVLLKQARRDYDMILVDAGVLGPETRLADCWLRGAVDAVITISRQLTGKQSEHEVLDWKQIGIESLGVIETFA
jgi:Mrp family chromosome partitioning ATPase